MAIAPDAGFLFDHIVRFICLSPPSDSTYFIGNFYISVFVLHHYHYLCIRSTYVMSFTCQWVNVISQLKYHLTTSIYYSIAISSGIRNNFSAILQKPNTLCHSSCVQVWNFIFFSCENCSIWHVRHIRIFHPMQCVVYTKFSPWKSYRYCNIVWHFVAQ